MTVESLGTGTRAAMTRRVAGRPSATGAGGAATAAGGAATAASAPAAAPGS